MKKLVKENLYESANSGKRGFSTNIEQDTLDNDNFRKVLYTSKNMQLVLMTLKPGEEIGAETHHTIDQFFRFEAGSGQCVINDNKYNVSDGDCVIIPAGSKHNIINTGKVAFQMYTLYSPPNHIDKTVHVTKEQAVEDEKNGKDKYNGKTTE